MQHFAGKQKKFKIQICVFVAAGNVAVFEKSKTSRG
jgi:hypothetical protein